MTGILLNSGAYRLKNILITTLITLLIGTATARAEIQPLAEGHLAQLIIPPFQLGEPIGEGMWTIENSGGAEAGYVFETGVISPIPGFSGDVINVLVTIDLEGTFLEAQLLSQNEPVFVSGLGVAPLNEFLSQYRGLSVFDTITVGVPYGASNQASELIYLDGVTKATASVRIAHEGILASAMAVVREKMQGIAAGPPPRINFEHRETLTWQDLVDQGLAVRRLVTNAEVQEAFKDTLWELDDQEALDHPDEPYLDLWVVDIGAPSVAEAVLDGDSLNELRSFQANFSYEEPILVIDGGRHGLVSPDFVRNTAPDWMSATQDGLPLNLRDADIYVELKDDVPEAEAAMVLRLDRRVGFDPARPWNLEVQAIREHGIFMPEIGSITFTATSQSDERFYIRPNNTVEPKDPRVEAVLSRLWDLAILMGGLGVLAGLMAVRMSWLAGLGRFVPLRLASLSLVIGFIGYWGQGQLSIVTPLAVIRAIAEGRSLDFLWYDPFSLLLWAVVIVTLVLWGRALFCGWLCPYGAMQELTYYLGRFLGIKEKTIPPGWDRALSSGKYFVLAFLVGAAALPTVPFEGLSEIEPFKTAITVNFAREWPFVTYALIWLVASMVFFRAFCRYLCPLGALLAVGSLVQFKVPIPRRVECGSPCQLCSAKCKYNAIERTGEIRKTECFLCLDCVIIHEDPNACVPRILATKKQRRVAAE